MVDLFVFTHMVHGVAVGVGGVDGPASGRLLLVKRLLGTQVHSAKMADEDVERREQAVGKQGACYSRYGRVAVANWGN